MNCPDSYSDFESVQEKCNYIYKEDFISIVDDDGKETVYQLVVKINERENFLAIFKTHNRLNYYLNLEGVDVDEILNMDTSKSVRKLNSDNNVLTIKLGSLFK